MPIQPEITVEISEFAQVGNRVKASNGREYYIQEIDGDEITLLPILKFDEMTKAEQETYMALEREALGK